MIAAMRGPLCPSPNGQAGADIAADALIRKYARPARPLAPPGKYAVAFTGVASSDDYIRLAAYLERLAVVKRATPVSASPVSSAFVRTPLSANFSDPGAAPGASGCGVAS